MKSNEELNALMIELLDAENKRNKEETFLERSKEIIKEVADFSRGKQIFKEQEENGNSFFAGMTAREIYRHMIIKVANAPAKMFIYASVFLAMPFLQDAIEREDNERNGRRR